MTFCIQLFPDGHEAGHISYVDWLEWSRGVSAGRYRFSRTPARSQRMHEGFAQTVFTLRFLALIVRSPLNKLILNSSDFSLYCLLPYLWWSRIGMHGLSGFGAYHFSLHRFLPKERIKASPCFSPIHDSNHRFNF